MTNKEFKTWRKTMLYSQKQAADALGINKGSIENYERGTRRENGRKVEIPKLVQLGCKALLNGITL